MSGIFGIFNRNGNQIDKKIANDMLNSMSSWNPDENELWSNGSVTLGHAMLWNTPESKFEHLPLEKDACILTMDARIDNRDELLQELELPDRPLEEIGDSEFILAAYRKWGEECPKYLLGDFVFAIWDEKKQQLFCVRDHIGIKLFHFYLSDELFVFSNDIEAILTHSNVPQSLNNNIVATYLKNRGVHTERETFFKKIQKLPPATCLTITCSDILENQYWNIESCSSVHYDSYEEYIERLKKLYDNAVEVRLRTTFPIASHLSGGIDSSPIAVLAARKLKKQKKHLFAYNWINIPDNKDEYELEAWVFSRRVAEQEINISHQEFNIDAQYIANLYQEHNIFTKGNMEYWEEYYVQDMVKGINARTLLSGWGGDELITFNGYTYIQGLFSRMKIREAFKYLFDEKKYLNYSWKQFIIRTIKQIIPIIRRPIRQIIPKKKNLNSQSEYYKYLTPEFQEYMRKHITKDLEHLSGVRKMQLFFYHNGHLHNRIESWALSSFSKRIEYRYPLLDKRIVEFAIGIPEELYYFKKGKERSLIKNVVKDLLPLDILWFNKPSEVKVNRSSRKMHFDSFKILKEVYDRKDCNFHKNEYVDFMKIKETLDTFDFENANPDTWKLGNIIPAIILLSSLQK